jgi:hypothetical protein
MAGLLGLDDDMRLALMTAGLGTLAGRGGPMRAAGQGGLLGVQSYQQSKRDKGDAERERLRDEMLRAQLDEYKRKQSEAERMRQSYSQAFKGAYNPGSPVGLGAVDSGMDAGVQPAVPPSFDPRRFAAGIADVDPVEAAKMLIPREQKSPWADINPKDYTTASLRAFVQTKDPSVLVARDDTKPVSKWVDIPAPPGGAGQQWQRNMDTQEIRAVGSRAPVTNITTNNYPDLPKDYMWTDPKDPRKGVTPIPGSAPDVAGKAKRAEATTTGNIVLSNVSRARDMVQSSNMPMTGFVGSQAARIPGTPQYDLAQTLDPIKANIRIDALTTMRAMSPTGAALGNVTEKEGEVLTRKYASLEQAQSREQFLRGLDDVEREYNRIVHGAAGGPVPAGGTQKRVKFSDLPR